MSKWTIRGLVFSALFAAVMSALSYLKIQLPFTPIPITLSTLGIMLAGSILGARYGFLAVFLVVALLAANIPTLAGTPGIARLLGPTGGYIWAYPVAAFLIGYFAERMKQDKFTFVKLLAVNFVFGSLFLYPTGVWWLLHNNPSLTLAKALTNGVWPFLPGDFLKALVCAAVTVAVWRVYPTERITGHSLTR